MTPRSALPPKPVSQNENPGPSLSGLYAQYKSAFFAVALTFLTVTGYTRAGYVYYYRAFSFSDIRYICKIARHREQLFIAAQTQLYRIVTRVQWYQECSVVNLIKDSYRWPFTDTTIYTAVIARTFEHRYTYVGVKTY